MKTIAFHLQKGGVGKTTLSVSVAWELANMGYSTVLCDCDPQGNASSWLLEGRRDPEFQLSDVLTRKADPQDAAVQVEGGLYCIPTFGATSDLRDYAKGGGSAAEPYAIADMLDSLPFQFAVLDMGPGLYAIEQAALIATNEVLLTMTPEYFALDGLETWTDAVKKIEKGLRVKIHYSKLVVNGMNRAIGQMQEVHTAALKAARDVYTIGQDPAFRKAQAAHIPAQALTTAKLKAENRLELQRIAKGVINGTRKE